jgi:hypothetical protein
MDDLQYRVDNIDTPHPNIYISSYSCPLYHMNYLPHHIATLFTSINSSQQFAVDYLPSNCIKISMSWCCRTFALYNLPPLITHTIEWAGDEDRSYNHHLLPRYAESINSCVILDFCDIMENNRICKMRSYFKQYSICIN